jgi:hypothetical protein
MEGPHERKFEFYFLGISEKELKKLAKAAEKEAKNEVKIEVTDTTEETLENAGGEDGGQTSEENQENQDGATKTNKEKTFWIEYNDFWKCFGYVLLQYHLCCWRSAVPLCEVLRS